MLEKLTMKVERSIISSFVNNHSAASQSAVIFLGGEMHNEALACEIVSRANLFLCADSGAEHARKLGLIPHAIIGDLDSVMPETLKYFEELHCEIIRIPDQESNDFEKTLAYLSRQFQNSVYVFGMTGGRTDHTLANFSVMLRYTDRFDNIIAFELGEEHTFLTTAKNKCKIECENGTTISLTPFVEANGIVTENLQYPLLNETLRFGIREGVSNISTGSPVSIAIDSGALLVTVLGNL